ncbi:glycoside hydrolase family 88 protein [Asticcacaulis machinosus]|uniref:Glycoside hydrolase family 88 protein n=1 Tax=Asticcacaulis machinosus TaxID=2984211 RepID=A0ABT5HJB0_9CAUL|nr:glycoside hydrolase family 88 protein [Asticcacaulis machinosus]MDC7676287.1 glycoside hydrolase family 88 protein [Asticcacaulis machinosus]
MTTNLMTPRQSHSPSTAPAREPLPRRNLPTGPNKDLIDQAIGTALARIDKGLAVYGDQFPEPSSVGNVYRTMGNTEWTNGFWTGQLWLAYELSGDEKYRTAAERHVESFHARIFDQVNVDHHDLGFLYSLSCVAASKLTDSTLAREAGLEAARLLLTRYLPKAGIIQAWGNLSDPAEAGRMIIDCNLNLPLLYWATEQTGDLTFADAADTHIQQALKYIVRPDASTFHTFYMDPVTGAPRHGTTHQGYADDSCWARGQAWGIAGFPLVYRYFRKPALIETSARLANYFLNRLPQDLICCWDLVFTDAPHERDSSAAAIAACGLLELGKSLPLSDTDSPAYRGTAIAMVESLIRLYAATPDDEGAGLLKHGVYHMPKGIGVDEYCLWGDYFYLEALTRLTRIWEPYW